MDITSDYSYVNFFMKSIFCSRCSLTDIYSSKIVEYCEFMFLCCYKITSKKNRSVGYATLLWKPSVNNRYTCLCPHSGVLAY